MMQEQIQKDRSTDLGIVRINNDVIASIASIAATEVKGVYRIGGRGVRCVLCNLFTGKLANKGVRVKAIEGEVKLSVSVVVDYGVDIPRIADEVQESVKRAVEKMTGLILSEVDVVVEGVTMKKKEARI